MADDHRPFPIETFRPSGVGAERLMDAFLKRRKPATIDAYRRDLLALAAFVGVTTVDDLAAKLFGPGAHAGDANLLALEWQDSMLKRGHAPASVNRRVCALLSLSKVANRLGLVPWRISIDGVKTTAYRDTRGPGLAAVEAILAHLKARTDEKAPRDLAIFRLLWARALRNAEVCGLDLADTDLGPSPCIWVLRKWKNERERMTLPARTADAIRSWIVVRGSAAGPLFTAAIGEDPPSRISPSAVRRMVSHAGAAVGAKAWPHGIRHTSLTLALERFKGDVRKVRQFSGHKSVETLLIYDDARTDAAGEVAAAIEELEE